MTHATSNRLFAGDDVLVERIVPAGASEGRPLVVTFTSYSQSLPPKPFAASYLARLNLPCIAFRSLKNHWWQTREMETCFKLLEPHLADFGEVITYGSSMGAHAALAFSQPLRATRVIAAAPQFSISRDSVPQETRWAWEAQAYPQIFDPLRWISPTAEKFILSDRNHVEDRAQIKLFTSSSSGFHHINVPYSKHSPLKLLLQNGILSDVVTQLIMGQHDPAKITQIIRRAGQNTLNRYTTVLGKRYPKNPRRIIRALEPLCNRLTQDASGTLDLAKLYHRCKDRDRAVKYTLTSITLRPNQRNIRFLDDMMSRMGREGEVPDMLRSAVDGGQERVHAILKTVRRKKAHDRRMKSTI